MLYNVIILVQPIDKYIYGGKMFNLVLLIGKMTDKPVLRTLENGQIVGHFAIAVQRPFKNMDGEYETYFINCSVWNAMAQNMVEYCNKGSTVAVRGHLITKDEKIINDKGEQINIKIPSIYVERINFISL